MGIRAGGGADFECKGGGVVRNLKVGNSGVLSPPNLRKRISNSATAKYQFTFCHISIFKQLNTVTKFTLFFTLALFTQWRSQPDNLVPLCKFKIIIIIHFFRN